MRIFTVINQKGGCGKTTSAINLAAAFARTGCRTLLVDLDPQSHCAAGLGVPENQLEQDVSDALRAPIDEPLSRDRLLWHVGRNLDLLPSRMKLAGIEAAHGGLADQPDKELRLRAVLDRLTRLDNGAPPEDEADPQRRYDVCLIDCPPSIGLLSYNAIAAGREVIIPVETSFFSLRGAAKQVQTARSIARRIGMRIHPRLLATMHDPSRPLARDLLDDLRDRFGAGMIPVVVRYDHCLKEAASFGQPIDEYAPDSMGAEDYRSVCEWLIEHAGVERPEPGEEASHGAGDEPGQRAVTPKFGGNGPTLSQAALRVQVAAANVPSGDSSCAEESGTLTRAQELALRARTMQAGAPEPLKRSMMPHKPIAIEIAPEQEQEQKPSPALMMTKVRHLFGVRQSSSGVLFVQPISLGRCVQIAGDFNGWRPEATPMVRNEALGVFEKHLKLAPGEYQCKLVVDGRWVLDEYNREQAANGLGGCNNLIRVSASPRMPS